MPDPDPLAHDHQDDVRRLLAEARYDGPVPVDVAARLDRVLEQLAAGGPVEVEVGSEQEPVDDLDAHRRRRRARNLLLAAAAVVVVGVGLGQLGGPASDSESDDSAAGGSSYVTTSDADVPEAASQDESSPTAEDYSLSTLTKRLRAPEPTSPIPVVVRDRDFASTDRLRALRDLRAALHDDARSPFAADAEGSQFSSRASSWYACKSGPYGEGRLVAVQYDAHPAVLAIRPATGDSTVVELLRCGSGAVLRSATVPLS